MKQILLSLVLASALFAIAGALFFARSVTPGPEAPSVQGYERLASSLETEVAALKGRLADLEQRLSRQSAEERSNSTSAGSRVKKAAEAAEAVPSAAEDAAPGGKGMSRALASLAGAEADELRSFVNEVIQEEREQRRQDDRRRIQERQEELAALQNGPYGQFNYRVNTMGKRLELNEVQKQRYHELLADYSSRIDEIRKGLNRQDPAAYKSYQDRKRQIIEEFDGLVIQSLTPPQAQNYQELSSHEKSPSPENATGGRTAIAVSRIGADGDVAIEETRAQFLFTAPEGASPVNSLPIIDKLFEVAAPEAGAAPAPVK